MTIAFPNHSRSYDPRHQTVRFWGHDDSLEVTFLVEGDALTWLAEETPRTEQDIW